MDLFSKFKLGALELPSRVVMAPMTRSRAVGGVPNELMRTYYSERAGAALIVTEGVAPSPNGLGYARIPGLFSDEQVHAWRRVTDSVHEAGGRIFAQLMHVGRIAHPLNLPPDARIVSPSGVRAEGMMWTDQQGQQPFPEPEAMSADDLRATIFEYANAAKNAVNSGFDGVELHAANGYLLEQFLHPHTNRRADAYGGSVATRTRFVVEVVEACVRAIGQERVGIRLSPHSTFNDLPPHAEVEEQYARLAEQLKGLVYLHIIQANHADFAGTFAALGKAYGGPLILNGGFDKAGAEQALNEGRADLIAFGRPFIANPDLVTRLQKGVPLATPNPATFYTPGPDGYVDYPAA